MSRRHFSSFGRPCGLAVGLCAGVALLATSCDAALARAPRGDGGQKSAKHEPAAHRPSHGSSYRPPYSDIVIDANSGEVLHEDAADEPRHPASLTKIMTAYLLFEQLEAGNLKLDTPLKVSKRAAMTLPVRLGLKADQTILVEEALKALVTKSANDAAVTIAEAISGSEEEFAKLMTRNARALGMSHTTYTNASGLPGYDQITTARDQSILGRAIQDRFPDYYRFFQTMSWRFKGREIHTHISLMGSMKGIDGIKTGYTEASGYNLVSSLHRDDKFLIAVVMGGTSNGQRDNRMRQLLDDHVPKGASQRLAPAIAETPGVDQLEPTPLPENFRPPHGVEKPVETVWGNETDTPLPTPKPASLTSKSRQGTDTKADTKADTKKEKPANASRHHGARRSATDEGPASRGRQTAVTVGRPD
jgi:D-alanyl-D-alanine carboxypeptidase